MERSALFRFGPLSRRSTVFAVALLAAAAYATSLDNGFVYDDTTIVRDNPLVSDPSKVETLFTTPYWGSRAGGGLYRPMTILSYALNHRLNRDHPLGYHLANVVLHAVVTVLVLMTALEVLPLPAASLAGLIFAVHPIHTEAVANVVGRAELLASLGFLLAWLWSTMPAQDQAGVTCRENPGPSRDGRAEIYAASPTLDWPRARWPRRALSGVAFAFGVFSKEVALVLPGVLLARDVFTRRRLDWATYAVHGVVLAAYLGLRVHVLGTVGNPGELSIQRVDNVIATQAFWPGLWTALSVLGRYAVLLIFPWRLSADYSYPQIAEAAAGEPWAWLGLLVLGGSCALLVAALAKNAFATTTGLILFAAGFSVVSNFVSRIGTVMAERLMYLPSCGVAILLAAGGRAIWQEARAPLRPLLLVSAVFVLAAGTTRCLTRSREWRDGPSLAKATLQTSPRSARAHFNMGPLLYEQGRREEAIALVKRATELDPTYIEAWVNLASYLIKEERLDEARQALHGLLRVAPEDDYPHLTLAALELQAGNPARAVPHFEKILKKTPGLGNVWHDLGLARAAAGDTAGAIEAYRAAARLKPDDPDTRNNLAWLLALSGGPPEETIENARRAVALRPDGSSWDTLAEALWRAGRRKEAASAWRQALDLGAANTDRIRSRLEGMTAGQR